MNKTLVTIFRILGISFIVLGVVLTIVSMTKFDVFTYKLTTGMIVGIAFPFVGIVLIVIATIMSTISTDKTETDTNKSEKEIAELVKNSLKSEQDDNCAVNVCKYCGSKVKTDKNVCPSCGAKIK